MLRTKPNPMSIVTIIIFFLLTGAGIAYAILVSAIELRIFAIILIFIFFILGVVLSIGTFSNYEEIKNDTLIIHRYSKKKEIKLQDISHILFYGAYLTLTNELNEEICTISTNKSSLIPLMEVIENNGASFEDLSKEEKSKNDSI